MKNRGVVRFVRRADCAVETVALKFRELNAGARYEVKKVRWLFGPGRRDLFHAGTLIHEGTRKNYLAALGDLPILSGHAVLPLVELVCPLLTVGRR